MIHVTDVAISLLVSVVLLNDLVEERSEGVETFVAAGVDTDAGVGPLATGEDALLEGEAILVLLILAFIPNVASQHLRKERLGSTREVGEFSHGLRARQV